MVSKYGMQTVIVSFKWSDKETNDTNPCEKPVLALRIWPGAIE